MSALELALTVTAVVVGLTGTWSPCGLSMVATIGPRGHTGGPRTTFAACVTFAFGALAGGVVTFGSLALLGDLVRGAGGRTAYLVAAAIAGAAALAELRGIPIVPQVRRQLPEHWRRLMPMPLAAALYGVLLGLGFTTFVLTFGVWALAGISAAVASPTAGVLVGAGFGVGRALPIVVIAPAMNREWGMRASELMVERPAIYRGFRLGDALALGLTALALAGADRSEAEVAQAPAAAAGARIAQAFASGANPSIAGGDVAFERSGRAFLRREGQDRALPGAKPALGGPFAAVRSGNGIRLLRRLDLAPVRSFAAPGADAIAISGRWLVYRSRTGEGDQLLTRAASGAGGASVIASAANPGALSRPSVWGDRVAYGVATPRGSRIVVQQLNGDGSRIVARGSYRSLVANPSLRGRDVLYVRTTPTRQQLRLRRLGRRGLGRVLASRAATSTRDSGLGPGRERHTHPDHPRRPPDRRRSAFTFFSTALGPKRAFLTRLTFTPGATSLPTIVTVRRPAPLTP